MTTLSRDQAAALLRYRCEVIAFEDDIDDMALRAGAPAACVPILRYCFVNFSEALDDFFRAAGHTFDEGMTDEELVAEIIHVWSLLSPHKPIGAVSVAKVLRPDVWGTDRLLFTLQCVLLCSNKHRALVAQSEEEWLQSGLSWTSTNPQQQFGPEHHPLVGTESERERSMVAWMAEAYREQMATVETSKTMPIDGAAEQQAWVDRLLQNEAAAAAAAGQSAPHDATGSSLDATSASPPADQYESARTSTSSVASNATLRLSGGGSEQHTFHDDEPVADVDRALLNPAAHEVVAAQLESVGMGHIADSTRAAPANLNRGGSRARSAFARHYQQLMRSFRFSDPRSSQQDVDSSFDNALFVHPFIPNDHVTDVRSAENTQLAVARRSARP
jgi:hypothetical protein